MTWLWQQFLNFILVEDAPEEEKHERRHGILVRMYVHRALYVFLALGMCAAIYGGAYWLYQRNLTNPKAIENYFITYKVRYDFGRYIGQSRFAAAENAVLHGNVLADPGPRGGYAKSVPVLLYHRIATDKDTYNVTPAAFEAQMFALKKAGYATISAEDYAAFIQGKKKLPAKSILITFDDGSKDSYYPTDPIFKALGFRATEFVITKYSIENYTGSHYYLSAIELKAMERSGHWDIEPHTDNGHSYYPISANGTKGEYYPDKLWLPAKHRMETDAEYAARVYSDIVTAKREVKNFTHQPADVFAFPFADIGENHSSNYAAAPSVLTQDVQNLFKATMLLYYPGRDRSQGYYNSKQIYSYRIQLTNGKWADGQGLVAFLAKGAAKPLPYTDALKTDNGWQSAWGRAMVQNGSLTINSTPDNPTGAGTVLDGSSGWGNYTLIARTTLDKGESYSLLARMQGADYRIGCYFAQDYFSVSRSIGNDTVTLAEGDIPLSIHTQQNLGVQVDGDTIRCLVGGQVVGEATDPLMPPEGSVGFSVYDPKNVSMLTIKDIRAVPL